MPPPPLIGENIERNRGYRQIQKAARAREWESARRWADSNGEPIQTPDSIRRKTARRKWQREQQKARELGANRSVESSVVPMRNTDDVDAGSASAQHDHDEEVSVSASASADAGSASASADAGSASASADAGSASASSADASAQHESGQQSWQPEERTQRKMPRFAAIPEEPAPASDVEIKLYSISRRDVETAAWCDFLSEDIIVLPCLVFFDDRLRRHCGRHVLLQKYVFEHGQTKTIVQHVLSPVKKHLAGRRHARIVTTCNHGVHRSVAVAELLDLLFAALPGFVVAYKSHVSLDRMNPPRCTCPCCDPDQSEPWEEAEARALTEGLLRLWDSA